MKIRIFFLALVCLPMITRGATKKSFEDLAREMMKAPQIVKLKINQYSLSNGLSDGPVGRCGNILLEALAEYWMQAGICTLVGLYGLLCYKVIKGNTYLGEAGHWADWMQHVSFTELLRMTQREVEEALVAEIQRRYVVQGKSTDFIGPLLSFARDVDQEQAMLTYYGDFMALLKKLRLTILLPLNIKRFEKIEEKINRLSYFRTVFLNWAARYKMEYRRRLCAGVS